MTEFKPLTLGDRERLLPYFQAQRIESSELTFTTMYIWREAMQVQYAILQDCLVFFTKDGDNPGSLRFPLGTGDCKQAILLAGEHLRKKGEGVRFYGMTQSQVAQLQALFPNQYEVSEMEDYSDYVYEQQRLATLAGKKLHSKRNHVNSFSKLYDYQCTPITSAHRDFIMTGYDEWFDSENPYLQYEHDSIAQLLTHFEYLGLTGMMLTVGDKLCAFSLGERLNDDTAVIHIEKANTAYKGAYSAINQLFAQQAWSDVAYINREEDCGIPGLRKAKQSYYPDFMIKKFKAILK